ncbi:MAG: hypothetical protein IIB75_11290 [Proteobacteria bacterium]|nr:hypothetical protein [Pseudomonadota bacterium]
MISLIFLIAITVLAISSMRSSNISLRMAQNEESQVAAMQAAQALADAIVADPNSTLVVGQSGYTTCTTGEVNCDSYALAVGDQTLATAVSYNYISARVERTGAIFRPPPRIVESSIDKFTSASFRVTATYDRTADGLGYRQISEGVLILVPKQ